MNGTEGTPPLVVATIRSGSSRIGQSNDTTGQDLTTIAVAQTRDITTHTEVVLFLADADRTTGHRVPILNGEPIPRNFVDESDSGRVRPQVTEVTRVALRRIYVAVSPVFRIEMTAD